VAQKKLEARPDEVTSASSVRHVIESSQAPPPENPDIMVGIKGDLVSLLRIVPLFAAPTPPLTQTWPPPHRIPSKTRSRYPPSLGRHMPSALPAPFLT
jgi:hypothetical protein